VSGNGGTCGSCIGAAESFGFSGKIGCGCEVPLSSNSCCIIKSLN